MKVHKYFLAALGYLIELVVLLAQGKPMSIQTELPEFKSQLSQLEKKSVELRGYL